jgi:GAF domain-containing protein
MTDYSLLEQLLGAFTDGEPDALANAANVCALLYEHLDGINWVGFYVLRGEELVLGPFQGKTACVRIGIGKGVCGAAAESLETQRVDDVHAFPGHIACDVASRSEIVVPLVRNGELLGVLDIDSPTQARFSAQDQAGLEAFCRRYVDGLGNEWI